MEDFLYLLREYPEPFAIAGILLFLLARLSRRNKTNAAQQKVSEARKEQRGKAARRTEQRIQTAHTAAESSDLMATLRNAYATVESASIPPSPPATRSLTLASTSVFGEERAPTESTAPQHDAYAADTSVYDNEAQLERMDMAAPPVPVHRGFTYHSAVEEPEAVKYHTGTFFGFQEVHGLHATHPVAAEPVSTETHPLVTAEMHREELVRAIVLAEVLGPPVTRRRRN